MESLIVQFDPMLQYGPIILLDIVVLGPMTTGPEIILLIIDEPLSTITAPEIRELASILPLIFFAVVVCFIVFCCAVF